MSTEKAEKAEKPAKAKVAKAESTETVDATEAAPKTEKPARAPAAKKRAEKAEKAPKREISRVGARKMRQGIVVSNKMMKTVTVKIERRVQHPLYGKIVLRTEKFKAHDETNMCDIGDVVELMETRPLSREKRFRVTRIVEKVK